MNTNDVVIEHAQAALARAQQRLNNAVARREREAKGVTTHNGHVRPAIARRVAERDQQIDSLRGRVSMAHANLQAAHDQLPQREQARKRAQELERDAEKLFKKIEEQRAKLQQMEEELERLNAEAKREHEAAARKPNVERDEVAA